MAIASAVVEVTATITAAAVAAIPETSPPDKARRRAASRFLSFIERPFPRGAVACRALTERPGSLMDETAYYAASRQGEDGSTQEGSEPEYRKVKDAQVISEFTAQIIRYADLNRGCIYPMRAIPLTPCPIIRPIHTCEHSAIPAIRINLSVGCACQAFFGPARVAALAVVERERAATG